MGFTAVPYLNKWDTPFVSVAGGAFAPAVNGSAPSLIKSHQRAASDRNVC